MREQKIYNQGARAIEAVEYFMAEACPCSVSLTMSFVIKHLMSVPEFQKMHESCKQDIMNDLVAVKDTSIMILEIDPKSLEKLDLRSTLRMAEEV